MAALNVAIPLVALDPGTTVFGPAAVADDVNLATITIDRTVSLPGAPGLNAQPDTTRLEMTVEESDDGGTTWRLRASAGTFGGLFPSNQAGDPYLASSVYVELNPTTGRRVRATLVVAGARVAVAGSLTVT